MECPICKKETSFSLFEVGDDYQDGVVVCDQCSETIATFDFIVSIVTIAKANNADKTSDNADNADNADYFDEDAAEERIMDIGDK